MKKIQIPYGREYVEVAVPDACLGEVIYPNEVPVKDEIQTLIHALENPIQSKSFNEFLSDAEDVLFIVNDGTRPTPTAKVLDIIYDQISGRNIRFIIATGVHRGPTESELREIFGKHLEVFRGRIFVHDSKKEEEMVTLGVSKNGTVMQVNRLGADAQKIVIIGSVEPHYFGGYTGGRKAFLPGIASYRTIEQNHKLALHPSARALILEGNPVHEDMEDAIQAIKEKEIFSIMTVLDREDRIYGASAGDITESLKAAIEKSNDVFSVEIHEKSDIVVAVAPYPMDVDLYQSQKALENGKLVLNPDGILILISKCRDGVGHDTFVRLLSEAGDPKTAIDKIGEKYILGYHKAAKIAEIAQWANMWAVTDLDPALLRAIFIQPFDSIQNALDAAVEKKGEVKIHFLMAASMTVPRLKS
jgi:nickel-dependent lactate racemase